MIQLFFASSSSVLGLRGVAALPFQLQGCFSLSFIELYCVYSFLGCARFYCLLYSVWSVGEEREGRVGTVIHGQHFFWLVHFLATLKRWLV